MGMFNPLFTVTYSRMVIDNLVNVEMVLASGEIVNANANENQDLFWGIRGTYLSIMSLQLINL